MVGIDMQLVQGAFPHHPSIETPQEIPHDNLDKILEEALEDIMSQNKNDNLLVDPVKLALLAITLLYSHYHSDL